MAQDWKTKVAAGKQALEALRQKLGGQALDAGLRGISRLAARHPLARPERYEVEVMRNVQYGPLKGTHALDIYKPKGAKGDRAAVLYLHGGGFRILSKDTHWVMALTLARAGHVVFVPNYRLAPQHPFPGGAEDACDVARWVKTHAADYGADTNQMVLAGESAGANLALVVAIASCWERPEPWAKAVFEANLELKAILPACGMLQVSDAEHRGNKPGFALDRIKAIVSAYLPHPLTESEQELADVICFLEKASPPARPLPPSFAVCGGADPIRQDTERLTPAWQRLGGQASHQLYGNGIHAFQAFIWTELAQAAWRDQIAFLAKTLQAKD